MISLRSALTGLLASFAVGIAVTGCAEEKEEKFIPPFAPLNRTVFDVYNQIQSNYLFRNQIPADPSPFTTVNQLIAALNDPFTFENDPAAVTAFDTGVQPASKGVSIARIGTRVYVNTIDPGGPAWRVGVRRNDVVVSMNSLTIGPATTDTQLSTALAENPLTLNVERATAPQTFVVTAEVFTTQAVEAASIDATTHYARLGGFTQQTVNANGVSGELRAVLQANPSKTRWVIDMRWNGGGSLGRACEVVDLFVGQGTITSIEDFLGGIGFSCSALVGEPGEGRQVVVLLNKSSASASEVVAAAFQDLLGSKVVGDVSFGKGVAQSLFDYNFGVGRLILVTHQVFSPNRRSWNNTGIAPDVAVALDGDQLAAGVDSQLQAAITSLGASASPKPSANQKTGTTASPAPTRSVRPSDLYRMQ